MSMFDRKWPSCHGRDQFSWAAWRLLATMAAASGNKKPRPFGRG